MLIYIGIGTIVMIMTTLLLISLNTNILFSKELGKDKIESFEVLDIIFLLLGIIASILFAPSHIMISYKNVK